LSSPMEGGVAPMRALVNVCKNWCARVWETTLDGECQFFRVAPTHPALQFACLRSELARNLTEFCSNLGPGPPGASEGGKYLSALEDISLLLEEQLIFFFFAVVVSTWLPICSLCLHFTQLFFWQVLVPHLWRWRLEYS